MDLWDYDDDENGAVCSDKENFDLQTKKRRVKIYFGGRYKSRIYDRSKKSPIATKQQFPLCDRFPAATKLAKCMKPLLHRPRGNFFFSRSLHMQRECSAIMMPMTTPQLAILQTRKYLAKGTIERQKSKKAKEKYPGRTPLIDQAFQVVVHVLG